MAGPSGHNLNIAKSRLGAPRFPFERRDVGAGYAGAGPVVTYTLSAAELARYGPVRQCRDRDLTRGEVAFLAKNASSLQHAAKNAQVSEARIKKEMARHCIAVPEHWKEDKPVEDNQVYETTENANENTNLCNENTNLCNDCVQPDQGGVPEAAQQSPERPRTRLDIAREKLTRDMYLNMKAEGLSDREISKNALGKYMADIITKLKGEWGLEGVGLKTGNMPAPEQPAEQTQSEVMSAPVETRLTITQAITLRDELDADIDVIRYILDLTKDDITPRVEELLTDALNGARERLERINKAFHTTEIAI